MKNLNEIRACIGLTVNQDINSSNKIFKNTKS